MWGFKRRIGSASQITTMTMLSLAKAFLLKQGFACTAKKPRSTAPSSLQKAQPDSRSAAQFRFPDSRGQWAHMKMKKKESLGELSSLVALGDALHQQISPSSLCFEKRETLRNNWFFSAHSIIQICLMVHMYRVHSSTHEAPYRQAVIKFLCFMSQDISWKSVLYSCVALLSFQNSQLTISSPLEMDSISSRRPNLIYLHKRGEFILNWNILFFFFKRYLDLE